MTANAIAISSRLEAAGLEKRTADAVASELVDYSNEQAFTKADGARLEGKIEKLEVQIKIIMAMLSVLLLSVIAPLFG